MDNDIQPAKSGLFRPTIIFAVLHLLVGIPIIFMPVAFGLRGIWGGPENLFLTIPSLVVAFLWWFPASLLLVVDLLSHHVGEYHGLVDTFWFPASILQCLLSGHIEARIWRKYKNRLKPRQERQRRDQLKDSW